MSLAGKGYPDPQESSAATVTSNNCCSEALTQLKIYQAFIFSVPIFFAFVLLLLFYLFYLRRQRVDWSSLRMRTSSLHPSAMIQPDDLSRCEMGLKKEVREMLPIIVFNESFSVKDTQCSVCLGDYQADDKLQQIPACRHTFHMDCIDHWLATHNTCPLCRQSIVAPTKGSTETPDRRAETTERTTNEQDTNGTSHQGGSEARESHQVGQSHSEPETLEREERSCEEETDCQNVDNNDLKTSCEQDPEEKSHQSSIESCEGPQVGASHSVPETRKDTDQGLSNEVIDGHIGDNNRDSEKQ